jgi:hypothetical protein
MDGNDDDNAGAAATAAKRPYFKYDTIVAVRPSMAEAVAYVENMGLGPTSKDP